MSTRSYRTIIQHYESCLERHGDSHLGVDWPNQQGAETRYQVMLEVIRSVKSDERVSLLDFGCGASHLYEYILAHGMNHITYAGLDLSEKFLELAKSKFPAIKYYCADLLQGETIPTFDYIVMNGVFTEKRELAFDEMLSYFKRLLKEIFVHAERGIAFNVMSKHVDWERDDLFHLPFDVLAGFVSRELTKTFVIRNDYGLYEYTTYVYH